MLKAPFFSCLSDGLAAQASLCLEACQTAASRSYFINEGFRPRQLS